MFAIVFEGVCRTGRRQPIDEDRIGERERNEPNRHQAEGPERHAIGRFRMSVDHDRKGDHDDRGEHHEPCERPEHAKDVKGEIPGATEAGTPDEREDDKGHIERKG
ncbi:MAG TPA: hypothetical protein PK706_12790 [Xanthobacteraceae bacterium]|jgi:hypothetical protein|nr:hypothetical protein [Xanthobacteraceae bacterium]